MALTGASVVANVFSGGAGGLAVRAAAAGSRTARVAVAVGRTAQVITRSEDAYNAAQAGVSLWDAAQTGSAGRLGISAVQIGLSTMGLRGGSRGGPRVDVKDIGGQAPGRGVRRLPGEGFSLDDPLGRINPLNRRMRVEFEGVEVRSVRDLAHLSDRDAWKMYRHGSAATDIHGDRLIVHHYRQNPHGFMVEVPESYHSVWNPRQHPFGNTKGTGLTQAERDLFKIWRTRYWKARGRDLLIQRGLL